jgi:hypothetical protein
MCEYNDVYRGGTEWYGLRRKGGKKRAGKKRLVMEGLFLGLRRSCNFHVFNVPGPRGVEKARPLRTGNRRSDGK